VNLRRVARILLVTALVALSLSVIVLAGRSRMPAADATGWLTSTVNARLLTGVPITPNPTWEPPLGLDDVTGEPPTPHPLPTFCCTPVFPLPVSTFTPTP
jgi:hypothetical protein